MTNPPAQTPADFPGKTLGIVGLILAILMPLVGMIISIVAHGQSKKAGYPNGLAKAGIIVGAILTALSVILTIIYVIAMASLVGSGAVTSY